MGHRASAAVAASSTTMPHRVTTPRPEQLQLLLHQAEAHLRAGRLEPAQTVYAQLLDSLPATQAEPAWRGMAAVALQMEADVTKTPLAAQVEARLRHGIALQPGKGFLHYALGNLCATGKRWIEAQQAFASAVAAEPDNPDYRFNLAISHERLRQPALALPHYQAALAGAESQPHSFNRRQAALRITALEH
jgi:uncharacterized protein HemY